MAPPPDPPLQRLRRPGRRPVLRDGPAEALLIGRRTRANVAPPPAPRSAAPTRGERAPRARDPVRWLLKPAIWLAALLPFALLLRDALTGGLGADPFEALTHRTGWWALALLLASLAVTPLRRLTGWNAIIGVRRLVGLFAFFYVVLHLGVYLVDQELVLAYVVEDVIERPYVTAGFAAFLLLLPLALTSTRGMIRRLGGRRWRLLHRLVYPAAALGVLHFLWLVKADLREPLLFGAALVVLLLLRLPLTRRGA